MRKRIAAAISPFVLITSKKFHVKLFLPAAMIFLCLLLSFYTRAQYVEFVENKGQWDSGILFKGTFTAGAVALKPDGGYRVMLHNRDDLSKIGAYIHGNSPRTVGGTKKAVGPAQPVDDTSTNGIILHSHIYEVKFLHANPHPVAVPEKPQLKYNNYFIGKDPAKWASKCSIYTAVTLKNVYPGIDVHYYTSEGNFKYDIIVNPGGDVNKVSLMIQGADSLHIKDGQLVIKTSVDDVKELAPYSYKMKAEGNEHVKCRYILNGNILSFKFDEYIQPGTPVVIDPSVIFCSFSGSKVDNWGYTATYDDAGNFFAGGIVFGTGFQFKNGAYQTVFAGGNNGTGEGDPARGIDLDGFDIGIMKFNSTGTTALFGTYIGGSKGNEQPHSLVADAAGNLIIAGRTTSSDYPTIPANTSIGPGGGQDIILTKLSSDGTTLLGSLRIGGTKDDGVNIRSKDIKPYGTTFTRRNYGDDARSEVILDASGNIWLASCTQSTDFPTANPLFTANGGLQDAVLLKFSPALNSAPLFSTYLGGSGNDAAFVLAQDPLTLDLYVGGTTSSANFPGVSGIKSSPLSGAFLGGDCDGFVSRIKSDGSQLVKSVYFGTDQADQIYGIDFSKTGNPIVMGTTEGIVTPINSPFNANNNQDQGKQFITKLQPDLASVVYSANFGPGNGGYPNISPTAFLVDICENVYVSGWGGGLDRDYANSGPVGLTYKANGAISPQLTSAPQGGGSFYFFVLARNATSQLYGAFLGDADDLDGVHVDGGTSRFDKNGVIYQAVCACGEDRTLPTNGAAYMQNGAYANGSPYYCNLTSIKIAFDLAGVRSAVKSSIKGSTNDTSGCIPLNITFIDTIGNAQQYIWHFGDGSKDTTTTIDTMVHSYKALGVYRVRLIAIDSTTCNISDTSFTNIRVRNDPATVGFTYTKLLPCDSFNYVFTNQSVPPPNKPFNNSSFVWDFGDGTTLVSGASPVRHHYPSAGTYNLVLSLIDTNYCNAPQADSARLSIIDRVTALFTPPAAGCVPYNAQFSSTSMGGQQFYWDFGDGSSSTGANTSHLYNAEGNYTVKLLVVDSATCNIKDSTSSVVIVSGRPVAAFSFSPLPPQANTPTNFANSSTNATSYKWDFGDGGTLNTISIDTPVSHLYNKTGTFGACLTAYDSAGCQDTVCLPVPVIIIPLVDVPNAFTPNGDGINDLVYVRGFGIDKMDWQIYNRWGAMVFRSTDQRIGWDGRYKGTLQPQEVYTYTLSIQFTDGTKYKKTGDITLLR